MAVCLMSRRLIRRESPIWDQFEQRWYNREANIVFKNNAYIAKYDEDN